MTRRLTLTRSHLLLRLRQQLEMQSFPRLQMALIVGLTGAFGLLASSVLLRVGLDSMALRYPVALGCAYVCFLGLLWLWLHTQAEDYGDVPDLIQAIPSPGGSHHPASFQCGQGGDFAGGGASGSLDEAGAALGGNAAPAQHIGKLASSAAEGDELAIPLVAVVLAIGLAFASLYVVYLAPTLFAELLLDGALSYTLYRHLRGMERSHWLSTAVHRTGVPFGITAVFLGLMGAAMAAYAPGARSIGDVVHHNRSQDQPTKAAATTPE